VDGQAWPTFWGRLTHLGSLPSAISASLQHRQHWQPPCSTELTQINLTHTPASLCRMWWLASTTFQSCRRSYVVLCFLRATITGSWSSRANKWPPPRQCFVHWFFYFFLAFPSFLRAVKVISTICFILTLISVLFAAMIYLCVCYFSYFFAGLQIELLDLSRFVAILASRRCTIRCAPYQIALIDDHFSWSMYQEYIGPRHLYDVFPFSFCLPPHMRFIGSLC
jgi:hypothetical protein